MTDNIKNPIFIARILTETLKSDSSRLENGENIDRDSLIKDLNDTVQFLEKSFISNRQNNGDKDEDLLFSPDFDTDLPENVQEWISSTFSNRPKLIPPPRKRLRSLVNAVRVGIFFDRAFRKSSIPGHVNAPESAIQYLKQNMNNWDFNIFQLNELTNNHALKLVGYELLHTNQLINRFSIDLNILEAFLERLEDGYSKYENPYHNLIHAADVTHTCFLLLSKSNLFNWISDLELFAILISAMIHDFEHTGTTNNYHIITASELALTYNDKSVLENYHISAAFRILKQEQYNILSSLTNEEYKEFRNLVIDMVLATDMSAHFNQVQTMKELVLMPENIQKQSIISFVLHSADISHPCKVWDLHKKWTDLVVEEFFRQGDIERSSGMACSPLCDRYATLVPQSQIGFINFIVEPCFNVLCDIMNAVTNIMGPSQLSLSINDGSPNGDIHDNDVSFKKPPNRSSYEWTLLLQINKDKWNSMINAKVEMSTIVEQDETNDQ